MNSEDLMPLRKPSIQQVASVQTLHLVGCLDGRCLVVVRIENPNLVALMHGKTVVIAPYELAALAEVC